jgi:UDP-N-acetylmuramoyl-tripeptide--D-alanyl-D-alanine ligase
MRAGCGAQIWAENIELQESGSSFDLCTPEWRLGIVLGFLGSANIENALAAAAVALALGVAPAEIQAGLAAARPVPGRLTPLAGLNGALVLDDSYNANPVSVAAAIKALRQFPGKSVMVLGNMGELGADAPALHEEIGALAKAEGVHLLLGIGDLAEKACLGFGAGARHFHNLDELATYAADAMGAGDVWLIKGSRSAGLDRLVDKLTTSEGSTCSSG